MRKTSLLASLLFREGTRIKEEEISLSLEDGERILLLKEEEISKEARPPSYLPLKKGRAAIAIDPAP